MKKRIYTFSKMAIILSLLFSFFVQINVNAQKGQKWDVSGNNISTGDFFGTTNDFPIVIKTNNFNRMTISNDGRVLIGENFIDPSTRFQVDGNSIYNGNITVANNSTFKSSLIIQNNLGIGTSTFPTEKLEINGKLKLTVSDQIPADDGTIMFNGDFLGRKNGSWVSLTGEGLTPCEWIKDTYGIYTNAGNVGINTKPQTILHIKGYTDKPGIYDACIRLETPTGDFTAPVETNLKTTASGSFIINHQNTDIISVNNILISLNKPVSIAITEQNLPNLTISKSEYTANPFIRIGNGILIPSPTASRYFDLIHTGSSFIIKEENNEVLNINSVSATLNEQLVINRPNTNTPDISITKNGNDYYPIIRLGNSYDNSGGGGIGDDIVNTTFDIYNQNGALNFRANNAVTPVIQISPNSVYVSKDQTNNANLIVMEKLGVGTSPYGNNALTVNGDIVVRNGGITNIKIYNDGKIWVKSDIKIEEINHWGDFVFDPDYKLKTLSEVEAFIISNKHLPGLPSAIEVEANGINLGEMTNILTQKIEELTIYIIEMNKTLEQVKKENDKLNQDNKTMKQEIENLKK